MKSVKAFQILIAPIHNVVGARLWDENVERVDIVEFTVVYVNKCRNGAA